MAIKFGGSMPGQTASQRVSEKGMIEAASDELYGDVTLSEMREVVAMCSFPAYEFAVLVDGRGAIFLQGAYMEADVDTGSTERQVTRRWFLSLEMTRSEIVQTVFKCVLTSMEHRAREWFRYAGNSVFGPHFDVDALWQLCEEKRFSARTP
jgi:hypothetical protein